MSAVLRANAQQVRWRPMTVTDLDAVLAIEQQAYSHPWSRGNFIDSIAAGHWAWMGEHGGEAACYWVAMPVLDEVLLLNVAVARERWGQGLGEVAMTHLVQTARSHAAAQIWLEVRTSNMRAQRLYSRLGFERKGMRKGYYPVTAHQREDAQVMHLQLGPQP